MDLLSLVRSGRFSAAERLRRKLLANGFSISPEPEFANVALACLRNRRLSGATGCKLAEYQAWIHLVPHRRDSPISSPLDAVVSELAHRGPIPKFRPFFTHTALVVAHKGYARRHFLSLARPMILHSLPTAPAIDALVLSERYAVHYEQLHQLPPTPVAAFIRSSLIQLFFERGWPRKSIDLLLAPRPYALPEELYQFLMARLPRNRRLLLKCRKNVTTIAP